MDKKIIQLLRKQWIEPNYRGVSLLDKAEYELTNQNQSKLMLSPYFNYLKSMRAKWRSTWYKPDDNNKHKILFLVYTNSHINTCLDIVKILSDKALVIKRDGITDNIAARLKQNNIDFNDIEGYVTKQSAGNIKKEEKILNNEYKSILEKNNENKEALCYLFKNYFVEMTKYIELINNMLDFEKPKIIVVMNEITTLGNIAVTIAKQKGIKTLCIQHGAMGEGPGTFIPVSVDKIAVWGNNSKRILIKEKTSEDKIVITGAPQFDTIINTDHDMTKEIAAEIGLDLEKQYILLTTQGYPFMCEILRSVCKATKSLGGYQLVIKTHPLEYLTNDYKKIVKKEGLKLIFTRKYLHPLISRCSLMITICSTTGLEALMLKKPLITINYTKNPDRMPYAESGSAIGVYRNEELLPAIKRILKDKYLTKKLMKNADKLIYDQCYKTDGKASLRVIELINRMISS